MASDLIIMRATLDILLWSGGGRRKIPGVLPKRDLGVAQDSIGV